MFRQNFYPNDNDDNFVRRPKYSPPYWHDMDEPETIHKPSRYDPDSYWDGETIDEEYTD